MILQGVIYDTLEILQFQGRGELMNLIILLGRKIGETQILEEKEKMFFTILDNGRNPQNEKVLFFRCRIIGKKRIEHFRHILKTGLRYQVVGEIYQKSVELPGSEKQLLLCFVNVDQVYFADKLLAEKDSQEVAEEDLKEAEALNQYLFFEDMK